MLDESLLDDPEALARADTRGLLRGAAESGARVRTAARGAAEAGLADLEPDGRPRSLLVAGPGPTTGCVADLLAALGAGNTPVSLIRPTGDRPHPGSLRWVLPGWAGPLDLLLVLTADGTEPGLAALVEQAYRRGCSVVSVAPDRAPLAEEVSGRHGIAVPLTAMPYESGTPFEGAVPYESAGPGTGPAGGEPPGTLWAQLTPLLVLLDRIGFHPAPPAAVQLVADRLDRTAERCGPAVATYGNPAKTLAAELAESLPLLWSDGPAAGAAGRHFARTLAAVAGRPALAAELPEALTVHGPLLAGTLAAGADPDDFFRDRVEDPAALHARVVLLREQELSGSSPTPAAREFALAHEAPVSELEPHEGSTLEAVAELLAVTGFAAVYLALASGERS
ncbi:MULTISPECIES: SIS domain-containing protein [Streptomyces]|uniref:Mannose-6-phosphate isomerase n=1 Tax=Streptomyces lycii TaxID=2654337 RepID=A0ABQ7FEE4_9ACTN|nr:MULTISPECIES: SIS domain-containing protein [Streptomyces]KAF4407409.1 mannose-6-phosphate isomerase [Streptomyces lycii]PGH50079.1 mannose-6-phosphate isomerase [Streptomyces sp. Ru87]